MNLKGVAPGYGTLVPLFAWRIKRNVFGDFFIIIIVKSENKMEGKVGGHFSNRRYNVFITRGRLIT